MAFPLYLSRNLDSAFILLLLLLLLVYNFVHWKGFDVIMSDMDLSMTGEEDNLNEDLNKEHVKEVQSSLCNNPEENSKESGRNISERRECEHRKMIDITRDKPVKVTVKVVVPVRDHPKFNFVGKLLGPKGNSLKRLQEDTMTKMAILGRGSMRDKHKEEELRLSGDPKFSHLHDDLHVEITAFAPPAEAHARIAYALTDVRRFLVPDYNDDIRQEQMWEMQILKERSSNSSLLNDGLGIHLLGTTVPLVRTATEAPSPTNSNRSQSPLTPSSTVLDQIGGSSTLPLSHPASRGFSLHSSPPVATPTSGINPIAGRKRPFLTNNTKHSIGPTKRTVMGILACARAAQAKRIPGYHVSG